MFLLCAGKEGTPGAFVSTPIPELMHDTTLKHQGHMASYGLLQGWNGMSQHIIASIYTSFNNLLGKQGKAR